MVFIKLNSEMFNRIYPAGSIYMSVNNTDPSTLFGGTWVQLKDRFLLGAGSAYINGETGGEATHKLTISEIPSHSHDLTATGFYDNAPGDGINKFTFQYFGDYRAAGIPTVSKGGDAAHNNMPPYLAVYMRKRTA